MTRAVFEYKRIWFIGNSLTLGLDADSQEQTFTNITIARLRAESGGRFGGEQGGASFISHPGGRIVDGAKAALADMSFLPDIVVIQYGENDTWTQSGFKDAYLGLINRFRREGRSPLIVCFALWDPDSNTGFKAMTADIKSIAESGTAVFVDITEASREPNNIEANRDMNWLTGPGRPLSDSFHPNSSGHASMSRLLSAILLPFIRKGPARTNAVRRMAAQERERTLR